MVIAVKDERGTILGYIVEDEEEETGDDPFEEDSRVIIQAMIEEATQYEVAYSW